MNFHLLGECGRFGCRPTLRPSAAVSTYDRTRNMTLSVAEQLPLSLRQPHSGRPIPVPPFPTHLFLHPSLLPLLIHQSAHPLLPLSFTAGLNLPVSETPPPVVSLHPPGLPSRTFSRTVSSELIGFYRLWSYDLMAIYKLCIIIIII